MTSLAWSLSSYCGSTEKDTHKRPIWPSTLGEELPAPNFARAIAALSTSSGTDEPIVQGRFSHTLAGAGVKELQKSCFASFSKGSFPRKTTEGLRGPPVREALHSSPTFPGETPNNFGNRGSAYPICHFVVVGAEKDRMAREVELSLQPLHQANKEAGEGIARPSFDKP